MPVIFADEISTLDVRYPGHFCVKRDHLSAANILFPCFFSSKNTFSQEAIPHQKLAKAINTDAATINKNFIHFTNFEQKIQHCYHNQFFATKDM